MLNFENGLEGVLVFGKSLRKGGYCGDALVATKVLVCTVQDFVS